jgi:propionaldehyde dehydrogenase
MNRELIEQIVAATIEELTRSGAVAAPAQAEHVPCDAPPGYLFDRVEDAVAAAVRSQAQLQAASLELREKLTEAMRAAARDNAQRLAQMAHEETGYGHTEHKLKKNLLAADKTPGVEDLCTRAWSGDNGLTLVEMAPFGVIGSIIPSTNPTSTVVNNSISMVAAGNAVVFNPHPAAQKCSRETIRVLQDAITAAGGPGSLLVTVKEPSLDTGRQIMRHRDISILAITGGEAVVKEAMSVGKRVIAAGPGNPPVVVDDTAVLPDAARDIVDGASFDNNVLCVAEKELFVFDSVADSLIALMRQNGAFLIGGGDVDRVVNTVLPKQDGRRVIDRKFVGRDASRILRESGVEFAGEPRLVIAEVEADHPFVVTEMLMPVLGIVRVRTLGEAVRHALAAENNNRHCAIIHSTNVKNMSMMARAMNTTIFVKNAPSYAGLGFNGEGFATLTIATTTGEGLTSARSFTRSRRCTLYGDFRII